jgi:hypothetical protein
MEREIDDDVRRHDYLCAPGHLAAMVFSNIDEGRAVLKTPEVITGNHLVCPGSRRLDDQSCQKPGAAYRPTSGLTERQKSSLEPI